MRAIKTLVCRPFVSKQSDLEIIRTRRASGQGASRQGPKNRPLGVRLLGRGAGRFDGRGIHSLRIEICAGRIIDLRIAKLEDSLFGLRVGRLFEARWLRAFGPGSGRR